MRDRAEASAPGSVARASWADFCAAVREVDALRARVRAHGPGVRFRDGWTEQHAWGARREKVRWLDARDAVPEPVVVSDGFSVADVGQGQIGDCYFIAELANLADVQGALDAVFVTAEPNPEGVFCVRLFVRGAWQHLFFDAVLPWCV
jgi:hypothetical protein